MKEYIKLRGDAIIERRAKDGTVLEREEIKNLVVNGGKQRVAELIGIIGTGVAGFSHIGIGLSATGDSVSGSDTELVSEVTREQAVTAYVAPYKVTFEKTFSFGTGEAYDVAEAGIFDGATPTGSTMFDRFVFSPKSVDDDTDLYVKITVTVG